MAVGFPTKVTYANGDVYAASDVNDTNGTLNLLNPTAKGSIVSASAANTPSVLTVGANDTVLTADSSTATGLKWATPSSGGFTELASGSLPTGASTLNLTSISQSYRNLVLVVRDFYNTSDDYLRLRLNNSTGTYVYSNIKMTAASTAAFDASSTNAVWVTNVAYDNTDKNNALYVQIMDYANTSSNKLGTFNTIYRNTTDTYNAIEQGTFAWMDTTAVTQVNLVTFNGFNFSGGTYVLYGVK